MIGVNAIAFRKANISQERERGRESELKKRMPIIIIGIKHYPGGQWLVDVCPMNDRCANGYFWVDIF